MQHPITSSSASTTTVKRLYVLGALEALTFSALPWLGELNHAIAPFLALYFLAFFIYLAATRVVLDGPLPMTGTASTTHVLLIVVCFAVLFRVTLMYSAPSLSDDIYRYIWDGMLINHGINPYQYPPASPELTGFRDALYAGINHKSIGTPYGPVTLLISALAERISHDVGTMKTIFVLFDGVSIFLLLRILERLNLPRANLLVYAWNPLPVVEIAGSGHNDPVAIALLLGAFYLVLSGRRGIASLAFAAAVAAKYFALVFLPPLWKHLARSKWLVIPAGVALVYAPFFPYLDRHLESLRTVGAFWPFNDSLFSVVQALVGSPLLAKAAIGIAFAVLALLIHRGRLKIFEAALLSIGFVLMFTSILHPWYLLWLLPFLCVYPMRAWIWLSGLIALSYHVLIRYVGAGIWEDSLWIKCAIYIPFYILLLADAKRALSRPISTLKAAAP
jgi:hypothetical protein